MEWQKFRQPKNINISAAGGEQEDWLCDLKPYVKLQADIFSKHWKLHLLAIVVTLRWSVGSQSCWHGCLLTPADNGPVSAQFMSVLWSLKRMPIFLLGGGGHTSSIVLVMIMSVSQSYPVVQAEISLLLFDGLDSVFSCTLCFFHPYWEFWVVSLESSKLGAHF